MKFRIPTLPLSDRLYVRCRIFDTKQEMDKAVRKLHGFGCHSREMACTVVYPDAEGGMIAEMFFTWRSTRPQIIAHEAGHAARAYMLAKKIGVAEDSEEREMQVLDRIVYRVHQAIHKSTPLATKRRRA